MKLASLLLYLHHLFLQPVIFLLVVMVTIPSERLQAKAQQLTTIVLRVSANMWPHISISKPAPGRYHKLERTRLLIKADCIEKGGMGTLESGVLQTKGGYKSGYYANGDSSD